MERYLVYSKEGFVDFHWQESDDENHDTADEEDILESILCSQPISKPRCFSIDVGDWTHEDGTTVGNPMLESFLEAFRHFAENQILWRTLDIHSVNDNAVGAIGRLIESASQLSLFQRIQVSLISFGNIDGILSGIEHNQSLELLEIHIQGNAFSQADGFSLEQLLRTTKTLKTLRICGAMNLQHESLCQGLAANSTLDALSIDLSSAGASDQTSLNIFSTLATHPSIQFLEITASSASADLFIKGLNIFLSFSTSLKHLSLSNFNSDGKLAMEELSEGLNQNESLKVIETYSAFRGETNLSTIFGLLSQCPQLERLYFHEKCIVKSDLEKIKQLKRLKKPVILFLSAHTINYLAKTIEEVLHCHPEIQLIAHDFGKAGESLKLLCDLNLHGRYLLDRPNVPLSLWPYILQKCSAKEDVLYFFLKGPAFAAR